MATLPQQSSAHPARKKIFSLDLQKMKEHGEKIAMLTSYDFPTALVLDKAGIDAILVGDSLGMVVLGYETTLPVTLTEMLHHCKAVSRAVKTALLIGDMPFMSYQVSVAEAIRNAGSLLQVGGMDAVKLEGGRERLETIQAIIAAGIPVMGHLGLTPQSVNLLGGFRPQGRTALAAQKLLDAAQGLEQAGCFSIVLESVPSRLAELISRKISIPTIGIGAGSGCDGQILVSHDILGTFDRFTPRFVKRYANLNQIMETVFKQYISDIRERKFPEEAHSIDMPDPEWDSFLKLING